MLTRSLVLLLFAVPAMMAAAREPADQVVRADLDMNGQVDAAHLRMVNDTAVLSVEMNEHRLPVIVIPIDGAKQFGICDGARPVMRLEARSEAPFNALGEWPRGYAGCSNCVEIRVSGGECDPIHFYWNRVDKKLDWWRE